MKRQKLTGSPPSLTLEQQAQLYAWAEFGTNTFTVARRLGVHTATIHRYLRRDQKFHWLAANVGE